GGRLPSSTRGQNPAERRPAFRGSWGLRRKWSWTEAAHSGRRSVYVLSEKSARFLRRAVPRRKLATSKPVLALTVQPLLSPAQLEVWAWLKKNWPTMVSAFNTSRERKVTLPPALKVCRPRIWVTLSKICR